MEERMYTESEVLMVLSNLVNGIGLCAKGEAMSSRYKQKMEVNGKDHWVTGRTLKDLLEGYLELCIKEGTVVPGFLKVVQEKQDNITSDIPMLGEYLDQFVELYKSNQETLTKQGRDRIIQNFIKPKFGDTRLNEIKLNDLQRWFLDLDQQGYSHETLLKIKNTMSPCLDAAMEDGYILRNPLKSSRLIIGGTPTEHHKAIPSEKMKQIRCELPTISDMRIRIMLGLLGYTGMRLEEVLGLRWEDVDFQENWIDIRRAVIHPGRNQPEVKDPKTKTSKRRIPLPEKLKNVMRPRYSTGFVLWSASDQTRETPLSYTEARNTIKKIRDRFGISEYSAHDFRDTCATEWREAGIPTDVIARLLGHSKSDITESRYVKYRDELYDGIRIVMNGKSEKEEQEKYKEESAKSLEREGLAEGEEFQNGTEVGVKSQG